ncbi:hypothetical protein DL96DRAFT_1707382 [Flagelloscypha sp. PMI_526]|nr:hypothetical protein DL96DRAFT_1707382 [Flagelloscypha sp. PMI_526]
MSDSTIFHPVLPGSPAIPFLDSHNTGHDLFITHIDETPLGAKLRAFLVPLLLNSLLGSFMLYRIFLFQSHYYAPCLHLLSNGPTGQVDSILYFLFNMAFDTFLYRYLTPVLRNFVIGNLWFRLRTGFRAKEIVWRKAAGWRRVALDQMDPSRSRDLLGRAISSASDPHFVNSRTGHDTATDLFIMDYKAMLDSYLSLKTIPMDQWNLRVWQKKQGSWAVWDVWRIEMRQTNAQSDMDKIAIRLTEMGKPNLMDRWARILRDAAAQKKSSHNDDEDGSESDDSHDEPQLPRETHSAVVELFAKEGIDFEKLCNETLGD